MKRSNSFVTLLVFSVLSLVVIGCNDQSPPISANSTQQLNKAESTADVTLAYTGYARNGAVVVRGQLTLVPNGSGGFSGNWMLRSLADSGRIGPQIGAGRLTGRLSNGVLNVNLNPNFADNNVILNGRFARDRYAGKWSWIGFPGVLNSGTFQAVRVRTPALENAE